VKKISEYKPPPGENKKFFGLQGKLVFGIFGC
jgi:hypothetical protein